MCQGVSEGAGGMTVSVFIETSVDEFGSSGLHCAAGSKSCVLEKPTGRKLSPAGTAELSPGRSPVEPALSLSNGDDWKFPGTIGFHLALCVSNSPQNRHPERSASQIYRVTQRLWRGVEGPRRCLSYPGCSELFNHRSPHRADPPRHRLGDGR